MLGTLPSQYAGTLNCDPKALSCAYQANNWNPSPICNYGFHEVSSTKKCTCTLKFKAGYEAVHSLLNSLISIPPS